MNKKVTVSARWYGAVPHRNCAPLPKNQWARAGRKRKWTVRWHAPDGKRPRQTFDTKEDAEAFAREKVAEFESCGSSARLRPQRKRLGEFLAELLELRTGPRGQRLSIASVREYRTIVGRFAAFIGADTPLDRLTIADAMRYLAALRSTPSNRGRPLSLSSINKHKQTLKSAMNIAILLGYLQTSPFASIKKDKVPEHAIRYIDPAEFAAIVSACRDGSVTALWWECFLAVCYTAATRLNEAAHLTWADVDFEANTVRIIAKSDLDGIAAWRPKDLDSRTIPVPDYTISRLSQLHADAEAGATFVFLSPARVAWIRAKREAGTWSEDRAVLHNVNKNFKSMAHRAGVVNVTLHDLRRSCITHWARKIAAPVVQALAGHSDIHTTLRYYVSIREPDMAEARDVTAQVLLVDPKWTQSGPKTV